MDHAHSLSTSLWLPLPRTDVFAFFADAANLERITPPFLRFEVRTPLPVIMRAGAVIDYRIGLRGIPMTWRSEITTWNPPHQFVDTQRRGPYREWVHTHTFEDLGGGTLIKDDVRYRLPGPPFPARLANAIFVQRELTAIFEFRHRALADAFAASGRARPAPIELSASPA